jgi:hypothetical protein
VFYLFFTVLFLVGAMTFGIAYIWIIPFYFNAKGVLYRQLFGIDNTQNDSNSLNKKDEAVFHA